MYIRQVLYGRVTTSVLFCLFQKATRSYFEYFNSSTSMPNPLICTICFILGQKSDHLSSVDVVQLFSRHKVLSSVSTQHCLDDCYLKCQQSQHSEGTGRRVRSSTSSDSYVASLKQTWTIDIISKQNKQTTTFWKIKVT